MEGGEIEGSSWKGKKSKMVHGRGGIERSIERGCAVRLGKDWRVHGKGDGRDGAAVEGLWRSWGKRGLESLWARWTVVVREMVRTEGSVEREGSED